MQPSRSLFSLGTQFDPGAANSRQEDRATRPGRVPRSTALGLALGQIWDASAESDLLFLEAWEMRPTGNLGTMLRVAQIRRANPGLAAEIRTEHGRGRQKKRSDPLGHRREIRVVVA
jgi:hypothetical protein